jgi:hypothetical protein
MSSTLSGSNTGDWRGFDSTFIVDLRQMNDLLSGRSLMPDPMQTERPLPGQLRLIRQPGALVYSHSLRIAA